MARSRKVGIDLDVFDAFGKKRTKADIPQKRKSVNVYAATRRLERLIPQSSLWFRYRRFGFF